MNLQTGISASIKKNLLELIMYKGKDVKKFAFRYYFNTNSYFMIAIKTLNVTFKLPCLT